MIFSYVKGARLDDLGFESWQKQETLLFFKMSNWLWGPLSLLLSGYWGGLSLVVKVAGV